MRAFSLEKSFVSGFLVVANVFSDVPESFYYDFHVVRTFIILSRFMAISYEYDSVIAAKKKKMIAPKR